MLGTFALKLVVFWSNLFHCLSMARPPYQKCYGYFYVADQDNLHFPAFFSKSTQREHILLWFIRKGFSGSNFYYTLPNALLIQTLELDKRRCILSEIGLREHYSFQIVQNIKLFNNSILSEIGLERPLFLSNCYEYLFNCCSFQNSGSDAQ